MIDLTAHVTALSARIQPLRGTGTRVLVGIAGPPASGKTTLADKLAHHLNDQGCAAAVVPQDGFHLDNAVLDARGDLSRKGAPQTFDAAGFVHLVRRLKHPVDIAVPVFDRARDIAIAAARIVPASAEVIIVEGNYLLFDQAPWSDLAPLWTLSVALHAPMEDLRARLIQRWLDHGQSPAAAKQRAMSNDIPNAQTMLDHALPATVTLTRDGVLHDKT